MTDAPLGWLGIVRLGLIQTALGSVVVLTTSTMNRVMVVELGLAAALPGALVALHYAVQILRPRWGYGSDIGGRLTPWILWGMATLAIGGVAAALATAWMATNAVAGTALAVLAFTLIGGGVSAAGTSLLVLLAKRVGERRRPAAATIVWLMMIAGFAVTASLAGRYLDPFSPARLVAVTACVAGLAFLVTVLAIWRVEGAAPSIEPGTTVGAPRARVSFRTALSEVWAEPQARRFTIFIFVSMLAYSAQDLILEPFAGAVFGLTPGESTRLAGAQHGGVLAGMLLVAVLAGGFGKLRIFSLNAWIIGGCLASAAALAGLAAAGSAGPSWPLQPFVVALGVANGAFAVAAIGSMMGLAGAGRASREGVRMGLWGAAQAIAFGLGGLAGTVAVDLMRHLLDSPASVYAAVFGGEAVLFVVAAVLAARLRRPAARRAAVPIIAIGGSTVGLSGR